MSLESHFNKAWYGSSRWTHLFLPLLPLVKRLVRNKRKQYLAKAKSSNSVPVIVIGNITVGGTGKSPMVLALVKAFQEAGLKPGIVSRGYGVDAQQPIIVNAQSSTKACGDEPVMLAKRAACPLVICQKRAQAIECLLANAELDVIISDDGLQHYAMARESEILMLDASRLLGNGQLLPVGPLREEVSRLHTVDFIVSLVSAGQDLETQRKDIISRLTHYPELASNKQWVDKLLPMSLGGKEMINVKTGASAPLSLLAQQDAWHVVAGIGNPQRFLDTLLALGLSSHYQTHWFTDHYEYQTQDLDFKGAIIMTEKDAVKCAELELPHDNVWYLPIEVTLSERLMNGLLEKINVLKSTH